jgi:hypothetical protein
MRQWACACTNSTVPCQLSQTASSNVVVDEAGYTIETLQEDVWLSGTVLNNEDSRYFKLDLAFNSSRACPMLLIELDATLGTMSLLVSNNEIPNTASRRWYLPYYGASTYTICPSNPNMTYGRYYIALENQFGNVYNSYRIRYRVVNSPTCQSQVPQPDLLLDDGISSTWLSDGLETPDTVGEGEYVFYRLLTPGPCTTVSASVFSWTGEFDVDIFASATSFYPTAGNKTSFQWRGTLDGDDFVNFVYCNPDQQVTQNTIYFGIRGVTPGDSEFSLIATSMQWEQPQPLTSLSFSQYVYELSYGSTPVLTCSDQEYRCGFATYSACDKDYNYDCCYLFSPIPATKVVQPLWPWSEWDESIGDLAMSIPWSDTTPIESGKLAWKLYLSRSTDYADGSGENLKLATSNPSTCSLSLNTNIVDSKGNAISGSISFQPKPKTCSYNELKTIKTTITDISSSLVSQTDISLLGLQQTRLAIASLDPVYTACQDFVSSLTTTTTEIDTLDHIYCSYSPGTSAWEADPCCNPSAAATSCCRPKPVFISRISSRSADSDKIKAQCQTPECAEGTIEEWSRLEASNADSSSGCAATFNKDSSLDQLEALSKFIDECRVELVGYDLQGSSCSNDSDCLSGSVCDAYTKRCNHTDSQVIECMANSMDMMTATILFNQWSISEAVTIPRLVQELGLRVMTSQCAGPSGIKYRDSYYLRGYIDACVDTCRKEHREPICFDRSSPFCVIDADCDGAQVDGACYRFWDHLSNDLDGCLAEQSCNWMDCTGVDDCSNQCVNSSISTHVCVDCSSTSGCTSVEDVIGDSARCQLGLCSTNSSAVGSAECGGVCDRDCPSCGTDFGCTQHGVCSDYDLISSALHDSSVTGACLYPSYYDLSSGGWLCDNENDVLIPNGCLNVSSLSAASCPTTWYTLASGELQCLDTSLYGCYDPENEVWNGLNESECVACNSTSDYLWQPYFSWNRGVWTEGEIKPLKWIQREYAPENQIKSTINYMHVFQLVKSAITTQFAFSYTTEAQCRYSVPLQLVETTLCNCGDTGIDPRTCFASATDVPMGQGRGCPFLDSTISTRTTTLAISSTTFPPANGCQAVIISFTPATQYKLSVSQEVSQALFRDSPTNAYWVVINGENAYVGQIISGGVKVSWSVTLDDSMDLCILPESSIEIASVASEYAISKLVDGSIIQPLSSASMNADGRVCAPIKEPGTYFASAVVPNYASQTNRVSVVQYRLGAAIYLACFVFGVIQLVLLLLDYRRQKILSFKIAFICVILVNCIIRTTYVLLPANTFRNGLDSIQFIVFELPTFLYFTVFTVIMYMWLLVVLKAMLWARRGELSTKERRMRLGFILANCAMYLIFVVFIYLVAILPAKQKGSPCFFGSSDSQSGSVTYRIKLAYWIFQAVVVCLVSAGFVTGAAMLGRTFHKSTKSNKQAKYYTQIAIISTVALVCIIFLLIRAAIFLWAAKTGRTLNVIVFVILEVVPQAMLLFYVHPFRCFSEEGRSSSSSRHQSGRVVTMKARGTNSSVSSWQPGE